MSRIEVLEHNIAHLISLTHFPIADKGYNAASTCELAPLCIVIRGSGFSFAKLESYKAEPSWTRGARFVRLSLPHVSSNTFLTDDDDPDSSSPWIAENTNIFPVTVATCSMIEVCRSNLLRIQKRLPHDKVH